MIEKEWFGKTNDCTDKERSLSSNNISLDSFWGLFLIAGTTSSLALIIVFAIFLHEHKEVLVTGQDSTWTKIKTLGTLFNKKDLSSHTFRSLDQPESSAAVRASPPTFSNQTNSDISFSGEQAGNSSSRSTSTPAGQSSPAPAIVPSVELANLNQEGTPIPTTSH